MKILTALLLLVLAAIGGAVVVKRLTGSAAMPIEGIDEGVPLTPVPTFQEAP